MGLLKTAVEELGLRQPLFYDITLLVGILSSFLRTNLPLAAAVL